METQSEGETIRGQEQRPATLRPELLWVESDRIVPLEADEVQVWRASTEVSASAMAECQSLLSPDELKRMERMRAGVARDEFVVGRALLRRLVGAAAGIEARSVKFGIGRHGKPEVTGIEFNVSHSKGTILLALCRRSAVGVDVEWMDQTIEALEIARQSFSAEEYRSIAAKQGQARLLAFYAGWTRKEAITKANGDGLTMTLSSFTVSVSDVEGVPEMVLVGSESAGKRYVVKNLEVGGNFLAALGLETEALPVRCFKVGNSLLS